MKKTQIYADPKSWEDLWLKTKEFVKWSIFFYEKHPRIRFTCHDTQIELKIFPIDNSNVRIELAEIDSSLLSKAERHLLSYVDMSVKELLECDNLLVTQAYCLFETLQCHPKINCATMHCVEIND